MKTVKKLLALAMVVGLMGFGLTGCQKKAEEPTTAPSEIGQEVPGAPDAVTPPTDVTPTPEAPAQVEPTPTAEPTPAADAATTTAPAAQ